MASDLAERVGRVDRLLNRFHPSGRDGAAIALLADLVHWCDANGLVFDALVERAEDAFLLEVHPDPGLLAVRRH